MMIRQGLGATCLAILVVILAACSDDSKATGTTPGQVSPVPTAGSEQEAKNPVGLVDCVQTPSQTEGPYYFDTGELRRDITEGLPGTPLLVSLRLVEAGSCDRCRRHRRHAASGRLRRVLPVS